MQKEIAAFQRKVKKNSFKTWLNALYIYECCVCFRAD